MDSLRRMSRFANLVAFLLTLRGNAAYRAGAALLVAWAALLAGLALTTGAAYHYDMPWDTVSMLDGAYRMTEGQAPHADYFSPIGVLPIWLIYLGMKWTGVNAAAIVCGGAFGFLLVTPPAWAIASRRLPAVPALVFSMFVGVLMIACRPLAFGTLPYTFEVSHISYAMWYNRVGWSLLTLLTLYWFLPPFAKARAGWARNAEGFAAGLLCALVFLTKVNFLAAAVGVTFFGCWLNRPSPGQFVSYVAGFASVPAGLSLFTRWNAHAWLGDLAELARVADPAGRAAKLTVALYDNLWPFALLAAAVWLLRPLMARGGWDTWREGGLGKTALLCGAGAGIGLFVLMLNTQKAEIPLVAVACVVALETALRRWNPDGSGNALRLRVIAGACIALGLLGPTLFNDGASVGYAWARRNHMRFLTPECGIIDSPSLRSLILPPQPGEQVEWAWVINDLTARKHLSPLAAERTAVSPFQFACLIQDGLKLLRPHVTPESRIFCLNHTNPFPLALRLPPPNGGCLWWDGVTFNRKRFPDPERVYRDVTLVMVPRNPVGSTLMRDVYLPSVKERFRKVAESALWELYERPEVPAPR